MHATVAALNVYPVKSCRGVAAERVDVTTGGWAIDGVRDREWMIVDARGRFVTQREVPRLALVVVAAAAGRVKLSLPGHADVTPALDGPVRDVTVWGTQVRGHDGGDEAAAALLAFTGRDLRIVRFDDTMPRRVNPDYAGASRATTLFSDGYPVLVVGRSSLDDLNARLQARGTPALPMDRFRPNLVIDGLEAFDEDHVDTLAVGRVVLKLVKPCTRCEITTTDQHTGRRGAEPLRTLSTYRRDDRLAGVTFGMNAIVAQGAGETVRVGDAAEAALRF